MISLSATTDTIEAKVAAAHTTNALQCYVTWRDITTTATTVGRTVINTNGTTPVVVTAAPAASTQRVVDTVNIMNNDTVTHTATVTFDANGTEYKLASAKILAGETLIYTDGVGWSVITASGAVKVSASMSQTPTEGWTSVVLGADVANTTTSMADVTGFSFPVVAHRLYLFRFFWYCTSASTNTGGRLSINGPATTHLRFRQKNAANTTSPVLNEGLSAYDEPATATASLPAGGITRYMDGQIQPSADGTVIGRSASEVAASAFTVKQGSLLEYMAVN